MCTLHNRLHNYLEPYIFHDFIGFEFRICLIFSVVNLKCIHLVFAMSWPFQQILVSRYSTGWSVAKLFECIGPSLVITACKCHASSWWRHQMETFSALLAFCGNSPVTDESPAQRPVTRSFCVFFDLRLNKRLSKQSRGWWFETPSCSLWCHRDERCLAISGHKYFFCSKFLWLLTIFITFSLIRRHYWNGCPHLAN